MAELVQRMRRFGTTIFAEMTELALAHGAINLGQGMPDSDGPALVLDAAKRAIDEGWNQYAPGSGVLPLREAIAEHQRRRYGLELDPAAQIQVSAGATEALAAAMLALCEPGDEVVVLEPYYDSYPAAIELAQGTLVPVRLDAPGFALERERLRAAITPRTKLILVNTPHNPTGRRLSAGELQIIADAAIEHDLVVLTDEVYEHLVFDGERHLPLATLSGMFERTLTISSAGKTFSTTGWKVGWYSGPEHLVRAVGTVKQFLTFANAHPFQLAIAEGLGMPDDRFGEITARLERQRDLLVPGLASAGMAVLPCEATYFVAADVAPLGYEDAAGFCRELIARAGVAAIPMTAFYGDAAGAETLVRFAFCKRPEVIAEAAERIARAFG